MMANDDDLGIEPYKDKHSFLDQADKSFLVWSQQMAGESALE